MQAAIFSWLIWNCLFVHSKAPIFALRLQQKRPVCVLDDCHVDHLDFNPWNFVATCNSSESVNAAPSAARKRLCDDCVTTVQVRIHWLMTRRTRTSTRWPESSNSTSGAWKTRCSPRSDSWISYPPPVSFPATGAFNSLQKMTILYFYNYFCLLTSRVNYLTCKWTIVFDSLDSADQVLELKKKFYSKTQKM